MTNSKLTLRSLTATAVTLPMKRPLGTSAKSIDNACLLLVDLLTQDGIEGRAYAQRSGRCDPLCLDPLERTLKLPR